MNYTIDDYHINEYNEVEALLALPDSDKTFSVTFPKVDFWKWVEDNGGNEEEVMTGPGFDPRDPDAPWVTIVYEESEFFQMQSECEEAIKYYLDVHFFTTILNHAA